MGVVELQTYDKNSAVWDSNPVAFFEDDEYSYCQTLDGKGRLVVSVDYSYHPTRVLINCNNYEPFRGTKKRHVRIVQLNYLGVGTHQISGQYRWNDPLPENGAQRILVDLNTHLEWSARGMRQAVLI